MGSGPASPALSSPVTGYLDWTWPARLVEVGKKCRRCKEGDAVFGDLFMCGHGAFAEYVAVPESALMQKPNHISFEDAATIPQAARIALQGLRGKRPLKKGQKVLINGAGGGMGTFAVQLAKYFGAEVTAVDSEQKREMLLAIGADHVVDYVREDCTKGDKRYDLILDTVTRRSIFDYRRVMAPEGLFVLLGGSRYAIFQAMFLGPMVSIASKKNMGINPMKVTNEEDLRFLLELDSDGKVKARRRQENLPRRSPRGTWRSFQRAHQRESCDSGRS